MGNNSTQNSENQRGRFLAKLMYYQSSRGRAEYYALNGYMTSINREVSNFASWGAMLLAIGAFIALSIIAPFSAVHIVAGIGVVNVIFHVIFAEKYFGERIKNIVDVYCVAYLMLTMPIQWFGTGGLHGAGGMWLVFTVVYCVFTTNGKAQLILLQIFGIEVTFLLGVTHFHPEFEAQYDHGRETLMGAVSVIGIGTYFQIVQFLQSMEFLRDRKEMSELQSDLSAHYQQSMAMNEELMNTTTQLEIANKTQKSFTASMNHELRSPLNGIEGCLQILLLDDSLSEEAKETVKNALTASKTINQTVNDLLDFAKLDEGKFEIISKAFDLRDVLDNISTIFKHQASAKNLNFVIQIPKDTRVSLYGDGMRVQQIMTNLISNGIKYTESGTVALKVTTQRGHLKFDVSDTGQGMSKENLDKLYEPFSRFNQVENNMVLGTGLGMSIVYSMLKAMNATIDVESEVGAGTTFHVDIPIVFYDSDILYTTPRENLEAKNKKVDLSMYRVLCVDDAEINRTVFRGMLKPSGAKVVTTDKGVDAIRLCKMQHFDILFLDHMMPGMNGLETLELIRKIPGYELTPAIMFTGNSSEEYRKLYAENGAAGLLMKPVMYEDMIKCFELI